MVTPWLWTEDYIILHSQILPKTYFTEDNTILQSHRHFTADHSGEHSWDAVHLASEILIIHNGYLYLYFNTLYFQCTIYSTSLYVTFPCIDQHSTGSCNAKQIFTSLRSPRHLCWPTIGVKKHLEDTIYKSLKNHICTWHQRHHGKKGVYNIKANSTSISWQKKLWSKDHLYFNLFSFW